MRLTLNDYVDPQIDPNANYVPQAVVGDEFLDAALLDPALFAGTNVISPEALERETTFMVMRDVARQQQHIVFDTAREIGILQPFVPETLGALQYVDFTIDRLTPQSIQNSMLATGIGIAADTLSAIPNIYAQIAALVLNFSVSLVKWAQYLLGIDQPISAPVRAMLPTQEYSDEVDSDVFNHQVRAVLRSSYDWSSIFMPRYQGQLSGITRKNEIGQRSIGWALGSGGVPKIQWPVRCPSGHANEGKKKCWNFTEGELLGSGGLGMMPGGERIYGICQTTSNLVPTGPRTGHPSMYDPRCDHRDPVTTIDLGSFYPTTTQGALSIWDFIFQIGPAMYTVDAIGLMNGREKGSSDYEIQGWSQYVTEIWEGIVPLWRNSDYEHRWGCSFWKGALQGLVRNYTVSNYGVGVLSWVPTTNDALSMSDQDKWEDNNVYELIIKEALGKLHAAQLITLGRTNIAAYLPIYGGVSANAQNQEKVMGAMREYIVARSFSEARRRILESDSKYNVVLADVIDPEFRKQIVDAGGGKEKGDDIVTLSLSEIAIPKGGLGLPGGQRTTPSAARKPWKYVAAGGAAIAATSLSYFFWDDLAALLTQARSRLPRRIRR